MRSEECSGVVRARAPLRLGFAGGGTDVSPFSDLYGGFVLNAAIDRYAYVSITTRDDGLVELFAADDDVGWKGPACEALPAPKGLELHAGVYNRILREFRRHEPLAITVATHSDAPQGSGLGSSSTMAVALVQAFCEYISMPLGVYDNAHLAYEIERIDLGFAGGKQDHYAAAYGGVNFMEFYADKVIVNPLHIRQAHRAELESSLLLVYTGISRESAKIIDEQVQNVSRGNEISLQAMRALKTEAVHTRDALLRGDSDALATAMRKSWEAKKKMAAGVSNQKIDEIYEAALKAGARAGKVSGAGGGGFMMFMVDPVKRPRVMKCLRECSEYVSTCSLNDQGAHSWKVT